MMSGWLLVRNDAENGRLGRAIEEALLSGGPDGKLSASTGIESFSHLDFHVACDIGT